MLIEPTKPAVFKYKLELVKRITVKEIMFAGITKAEVEKRFLTRLEDSYSYKVDIHNLTQQSNLKGDTWKKELAPLRSRLSVGTNNLGQINTLINFNEVKQKWEALRKLMLERRNNQPDTTGIIENIDKIIEDEKAFISTISAEGIYDILFPLIYGNYQTTPIFYKTFPNVFNEYKLPLKIYRKLIYSSTNTKEVQFEGELDKTDFDELQVSNFFKRLFDKYDLMASDIRVSFYSSYELDNNNHIQYGGQYLLVDIPGIFTQEHTYSLMLNN